MASHFQLIVHHHGKSGQELEAGTEAAQGRAPGPWLSKLSYTAEDLLPMADAACSGVSPFTSISHQQNAPQISHTQANLIWTMSQLRSSQMTVDSVE